MKKLLNTLYITTQGSYLHKERETIVIKVGDDKVKQLPALNIEHIMCFGQVSVSPFLMGYCGESGIGLSFFYGVREVSRTSSGQPIRQRIVTTHSISRGR